jgi:hypothetical protein
VFPVVTKQPLADVLDDLRAPGGQVLDKLEGLALTPDGDWYAVTDNDGVDEATGETQLLRLGDLLSDQTSHVDRHRGGPGPASGDASGERRRGDGPRCLSLSATWRPVRSTRTLDVCVNLNVMVNVRLWRAGSNETGDPWLSSQNIYTFGSVPRNAPQWWVRYPGDHERARVSSSEDSHVAPCESAPNRTAHLGCLTIGEVHVPLE